MFSDTVTMTPFVFILITLNLPSFIRTDSGLRGPPHVTGEMVSTYRGKIGDTVRIDCPIESGPSLQVYYEWKKDGETITSAWDRFRLSPKKLRIKSLLPEDAGLFQCKGTNGFGSKELSTRLIVQDENGNVVGGGEEERNEEDNGNPTNKNFFPDEILALRPSFLEITAPPSGSTFRPKVTSTLSLRCRVDGHPFPTVSWFKIREDIQIPKGSGQELDLSDIKYEDNGVYICIAFNIHGQINASFIVEVTEPAMEGPSIISLESSNLTAVKGQLIHFRCLIRSDTLPNVQWLRQLGDEELDDGLQMAGMRYKVMSTGSRVTTFHNNTYLSELSIPMEGPGSKFVCLATNSGGYKFEATTVTLQNGGINLNEPVVPMGMLIAIPVTVMILFLALALVFCCFRRAQGRSSPNLGRVTTTTNYATPHDAMNNDYQPPPHPFYNPRHHSHYIQQHSTTNTTNCPITHFGSQQYFQSKEPIGNSSPSPVKNHHNHPQYHSSPAYASVPICGDMVGSGSTSNSPLNRAPPLPSRPNFQNPSLRDRNSYNTQGLLTQPLLTQTGSSSDSRDSRHSGGCGGHRVTECTSNLPNNRQTLDHWCIGSGGSEGSWDRKNSRTHHQIRV